MSGSRSRRKGRAGEAAFKRVLVERDWDVVDTSSGIAECDLVGIKDGIVTAWEVKNARNLLIDAWLGQARVQAKGKRRWGLAMRLPGFPRYWLVLAQGREPQIWKGNE